MASNIQHSTSSVSRLGKRHHRFVSCQTYCLSLNFFPRFSILIADRVLLTLFPTVLDFPPFPTLTGKTFGMVSSGFTASRLPKSYTASMTPLVKQRCDGSSLIKMFLGDCPFPPDQVGKSWHSTPAPSWPLPSFQST